MDTEDLLPGEKSKIFGKKMVYFYVVRIHVHTITLFSISVCLSIHVLLLFCIQVHEKYANYTVSLLTE